MQPNNEIWSVNRTPQEKCFSLKIMEKMKQGNYPANISTSDQRCLNVVDQR